MSILSIMVRRFSLFIGGFILITPFLALAGFQPVKIVTRPGVATPYVQFDIDLSKVPEGCVNPDVKVVIVAKNAERTADRFDYVGLYDNAGKRQRMPFGRNVASKTDALSATPYSFTFHNFGITAADIQNIGGIEVSFVSAGGENSTGLAIITGLSASVDCEVGDECVIPDPITIVTPEKLPVTIVSIQEARPLKPPGTHGPEDSSGGGANNTGFNNPGAITGGFLAGSIVWGNTDKAKTSNDDYAGCTLGFSGTSEGLFASGFGFSVPSGATINGITVTIERTGPSSTSDSVVKLSTNGVAVNGSNKAQSTWSSGDTVVSYGGPADTWGVSPTLTSTDVNSANFGVVLSVSGAGAVGVDAFAMKVDYTVGASIYDTLGVLLRAFSRRVACRIAPSSLVCKK